jgi:hypothetical protein
MLNKTINTFKDINTYLGTGVEKYVENTLRDLIHSSSYEEVFNASNAEIREDSLFRYEIQQLDNPELIIQTGKTPKTLHPLSSPQPTRAKEEWQLKSGENAWKIINQKLGERENYELKIYENGDERKIRASNTETDITVEGIF